MTEALHCSTTKCMHYCYATEEYQCNMTVPDIQEQDNGVQTVLKLDFWWLLLCLNLFLDVLHTPSLYGLPLVQAIA